MEDGLIDGDRVRALRKKRRWTQKDLATASGVDQGFISRLENRNQVGARTGRLVALARALRVTTDELFVRTDNEIIEPSDPQLDAMMELVVDMTPDERRSAERYLRFVMSERKPRRKNHATGK